MSSIKMTEFQVYNNLMSRGIMLELINGKWFINGIEMPLYGMGGISWTLCCKYPEYFGSEVNSSRFFKWFIGNVNIIDGEWPEMPILVKAKTKMAAGYVPSELAYPLTTKELKLIHYLIDGDPKDNYAIFFYGVGGSGKSTICNLIASLFGHSDTATCALDQITEKFAREQLAGKRLWYNPEVVSSWSDKATGYFKKIVTGDVDQFEPKGKNPYTARYRCKALFCCNVTPRFDFTDTGLLRRVLYYYKNEKIQNPDGSLQHKKYTEEELIDIAVAALQTDMTNWTDDFIDETHKVIMETNNVAKYGICKEYDTYIAACSANGVYPYAKEKWEKLKELFEGWISTLEKKTPPSTCGAYKF
ncbi:MAG: hypothetical protein IKU67_01390 [Firmicutes bacterium]|nr:hypothetical protein [Bacillota bacterium]